MSKPDPNYGQSNHNIRPEWNPLVQRLQGVACSQSGMAIISVTFMVGPDGNPIWWSEPNITKLEPKARAAYFMSKVIESIDREK